MDNNEMVEMLKQEIKTRLDSIASLETEVDALQRTVDILRRGGSVVSVIEAPPEPSPAVAPAVSRAATNEVEETPDPELVAIINDAPNRISALRHVVQERGNVDVRAVALALLNSTDEKAAEDLAGCVKQVRQLMYVYKEFESNGDGTYSRREPPAEPTDPPPPKPVCKRCGGKLVEQVVADSLNRRETVLNCRLCGHSVSIEPEPDLVVAE